MLKKLLTQFLSGSKLLLLWSFGKILAGLRRAKNMFDFKTESFSPGIRVTILDWLTLAVPGFLFFLVGGILGSVYSGAAGTGIGLFLFLVWAGIFVSSGIRVLQKQQYAVYERFGNYRTVLFRGIGWVNFVFDRRHGSIGTLRIGEIQLYRDNVERAKVDFTDASAPVHAKAIFAVGHPEDRKSENWEGLTNAIKLFTYEYTNPETRIDSVLDGKLRPILESKTLEDAQRSKSEACTQASKEAEPVLAQLGVWQPDVGLIIEDIELPDNVIAARDEVLLGEKQAKAEMLRLQAPAQAVLAVRDLLKASGMELSDDQIVEWLNTRQGLDTIKATGSNVTLVGKDIPGLLNLIGVGKGG